MDTTNAPQIIEHLTQSLNFTPFDTKWIPQAAKFCLLGQAPKATGLLQIFQLEKTELKKIYETEKPAGFKCSTFGISPSGAQHLSIGDFDGNLIIFDLEKCAVNFQTKAHKGIVNCIDGIGG